MGKNPLNNGGPKLVPRKSCWHSVGNCSDGRSCAGGGREGGLGGGGKLCATDDGDEEQASRRGRTRTFTGSSFSLFNRLIASVRRAGIRLLQ